MLVAGYAALLKHAACPALATQLLMVCPLLSAAAVVLRPCLLALALAREHGSAPAPECRMALDRRAGQPLHAAASSASVAMLRPIGQLRLLWLTLSLRDRSRKQWVQ